jgi:glucokinase
LGVPLRKTGEKDSLLRQFKAEDITSEDVYNAAIAGDEIAKEIFEYTGRILGEAFSDFIAFTTPEAIILFGKPVKAGDLLLNPIRESMEANLLKIWKGKVKVLPSDLNEENAAILGAAALAW